MGYTMQKLEILYWVVFVINLHQYTGTSNTSFGKQVFPYTYINNEIDHHEVLHLPRDHFHNSRVTEKLFYQKLLHFMHFNEFYLHNFCHFISMND